MLLAGDGVAAVGAPPPTCGPGTDITRERIMNELAKIAFADPRDVMKWGPEGLTLLDSDQLSEDGIATVAEVCETRTKDGGSLRLKMHDKVKALDSLALTIAREPIAWRMLFVDSP
jgi:hypothetical protein